MNRYWYNHNPALTLFYTSIILLEKNYQSFIDDALIALNYDVSDYQLENDALLDHLRVSYGRSTLDFAFNYLTKKQRILLSLKINKEINMYIQLAVKDPVIHKDAKIILTQISSRLKEEEKMLDSIVRYGKISDKITESLLYIVRLQVLRQWKDLMREDYHGFHGIKSTIKCLNKIKANK